MYPYHKHYSNTGALWLIKKVAATGVWFLGGCKNNSEKGRTYGMIIMGNMPAAGKTGLHTNSLWQVSKLMPLLYIIGNW